MTETHTIEKTDTETRISEPKKYRVVIHNDDKTTFFLVVVLLMNVFNYTLPQAQAFAQTVHTQGKGVAGTYPNKEIAQEKTKEAIAFARSFNAPLVVTCESE